MNLCRKINIKVLIDNILQYFLKSSDDPQRETELECVTIAVNDYMDAIQHINELSGSALSRMHELLLKCEDYKKNIWQSAIQLRTANPVELQGLFDHDFECNKLIQIVQLLSLPASEIPTCINAIPLTEKISLLNSENLQDNFQVIHKLSIILNQSHAGIKDLARWLLERSNIDPEISTHLRKGLCLPYQLDTRFSNEELELTENYAIKLFEKLKHKRNSVLNCSHDYLDFLQIVLCAKNLSIELAELFTILQYPPSHLNIDQRIRAVTTLESAWGKYDHQQIKLFASFDMIWSLKQIQSIYANHVAISERNVKFINDIQTCIDILYGCIDSLLNLTLPPYDQIELVYNILSNVDKQDHSEAINASVEWVISRLGMVYYSKGAFIYNDGIIFDVLREASRLNMFFLYDINYDFKSCMDPKLLAILATTLIHISHKMLEDYPVNSFSEIIRHLHLANVNRRLAVPTLSQLALTELYVVQRLDYKIHVEMAQLEETKDDEMYDAGVMKLRI